MVLVHAVVLQKTAMSITRLPIPNRDVMSNPRTNEDLHQKVLNLEKENAELRKSGALSRHIDETFKTFLRVLPLAAHMYRLEDDDRLIFTDANPAADRILGVDNRRFVGKTIEDAFPMLTGTEIPERYRRICRHGEMWYAEQVDYRDDTVQGAFEVHAFQTAPGQMAAVFSDITDRKRNEINLRRAEEALRMEKEKFHILLDQSPVGVALIGRDGTCQYVNPKFTRIFGYALDDIPPGNGWFQEACSDTAYRESLRSPWKADMGGSDSGELPARTHTVVTRDGSEKRIRRHVVTMENDARLVLYDDVTEKTLLETRLQMAQKMEAIGTLAGGIAHDFNNILSAIIGYTEIALMDTPPGSPPESSLEQVLRAGDRARYLVKQILAFSRWGNREFTPLLVKPIVKETMKLLRASLPATIEIRQKIVSDATVMADPTQIHQIIMNLCTNAAHAMEDTGGTLEVSLVDADLDETFARKHPDMTSGPFLHLSVADSGHGMGPEVLQRIFDPFFTTRSDGKGTGMGLSVIPGILHEHGGTISVDSKPGGGTRFDIYLPVMVDAAVHDKSSPAALPTGAYSIIFEIVSGRR